MFPAFFDRPERRRLGAIRRRRRAPGTWRRDATRIRPRTCPARIPGPCSRPWTARASTSRSCFARGLAPRRGGRARSRALGGSLPRASTTGSADFCDTDRARLKAGGAPAAARPEAGRGGGAAGGARSRRGRPGAVQPPGERPPVVRPALRPVWAEAERLGCRWPSTESRWRTRSTSVAASWTTS